MAHPLYPFNEVLKAALEWLLVTFPRLERRCEDVVGWLESRLAKLAEDDR